MNKGELINEIIGIAKCAAMLSNKPFDGGDLFFSLAFKSEKELKDILKKIK